MAPSEYEIIVYQKCEELSPQALEMFDTQLSHWQEVPKTADPRDDWTMACICAVAAAGELLGGIWMEMGPLNDGPLASERVAVLELVFVREQYRRRGIATALLYRAVAVAKDSGCSHIRCNSSWDNPAEIALYKRCGFALADIAEEADRSYFTVRPL